MNNICGRCGRPVYFAERKTSLGRDWHPTCLRCKECGKILSPGQHAEHKGIPYCYTPCYKALYGPSMLGYGSNVHSPANYKKNNQYVDELTNSDHIDDLKTEIFNFTRNVRTNVNSAIKRNSENPETRVQTKFTQEEQEIQKKVQSYNAFYEGKVRHQITVEKKNGELLIEGPLRIYWGVSEPIQLKQCDDVPAPPVSTWRHSLYPSSTSSNSGSPSHSSNGFSMKEDKELLSTLQTLAPPPSPQSHRGLDDSILSQSTDGVVRRKPIRKFNTVAYRGDRPNKWKRASINGHIYNYDTSVFTPVLGSCTSVIVASTMTTSEIIRTLMEKFKVVNRPDEYLLSIVTDSSERLLTDADYPLLERIKLGPDESVAKVFIKERGMEPKPSGVSIPIVETEEQENLPQEVEQLLVLPEAVLTGVLQKFKEDEEKDVRILKARYELVRKKMLSRLDELRTNAA